MKKILILAILPEIIFIWLLGWALYSIGLYIQTKTENQIYKYTNELKQ